MKTRTQRPSPQLLHALDALLAEDKQRQPTATGVMIDRANEQHASTIADLLTENERLRALLTDHVGLLRGQAEIARSQGYYVAAIALEKAADEAAKEAL